MANSVDPEQTAPIGAVCSGSILFASILRCVSIVRQFFSADDFSGRHFSDAFWLGALRVKVDLPSSNSGELRYSTLWPLGNIFSCFMSSADIFSKSIIKNLSGYRLNVKHIGSR